VRDQGRAPLAEEHDGDSPRLITWLRTRQARPRKGIAYSSGETSEIAGNVMEEAEQRSRRRARR